MYTVLIADDEAIVRMMLSSMIDWDEMELKLAGVAQAAYLTAVRPWPIWSSIRWIS